MEEALELDCKSNTDYWAKAIAKENKQVKVSWHAMDGVTPDDVHDGKVKELTGHQEIRCHMISDVKMDFTQKVRFIARGNFTTTTPNVAYSSVIFRDSVPLAFLIAGLNDLNVVACDISNACLNAPCGKKI